MFGEKEISDVRRYANTEVENIAIALIPNVVKRGLYIAQYGDHKERSISSATFAAQVKINGVEGTMVVVVRKMCIHTELCLVRRWQMLFLR